MTKRFFTLLISLMAMVTTANAQVVFDVPDPIFREWFYDNFYELKYYKEYYKNGYKYWRPIENGEIIPASTVSLMAEMTYVFIDKPDITSLKGIELFPALEHLDCHTDLTSLDVSQNTALTWLDCEGCQLTSLDLSKNTALQTLECNNNQLTSLDVSGCIALTGLICYNNQLTSLDVSQNTALTWLDCDYNQLTALDVSQNTALKELRCNNNQLTSLELLNNSCLEYLSFMDNFIKEEEMDLIIYYLPYDYSGFRKQVYVYRYDDGDNINLKKEGNVCTPSQAKAFRAKGWTPYYLYDNYLYDTSIIRVTSREYFGFAPGAQSILLNEDNFPDANFRKSLYIHEGDVLTPIDLSRTSLAVQEKDIEDLRGIEHFVALESLNCSDNLLTSLDVSQNTALTWLDCEDCLLTSLDLSKNTALLTLECNYNQLTSLDVSKNSALEYLECYMNQLTALDVSQNTALKELECYMNQLTALDVSQNTALKELRCYMNQLTALDVSQNTALTSLVCFSNQIKGAAMDALVASLPTVESGEFYVINTKDENEGNVCTKAQVAVAKGKGWTVYDYNGRYINRQEYEGSDEEIILDEENFPDDNFRNAIAKELGLSVGSEINEGLIVATIKLDVSDGKITELSGIEYFTALTTIYCQINQISDKAMTSLIGALPDLSGNEAKGLMLTEETNPRKGALYALDFTAEEEQNVCTAEHVAAANAKGWTVYCKTTNGWQEYTGEVPTGIGASLNDNGKMTNDNYYSIDGVKLSGEPTKKGVYIHKGKKVVK